MSQTELNEASSGFWEIGNYKANVQRIHQGSEQLEDIARFIKDRIAIENNYSKHLERWNDEWRNYSDKYLREGSVKSSFDLLLEESQELTKVHQAVKERFNDEVLKTIELFKRDNYHKSTFRGFKEAKEIEDEFEKAQKQWKKLFEKVEATKRNYHALARAEKSAYIQFMNSKADQSIADTASEKCKERFDKCQEELKKAKNNYEVQVREITAYNNIYMENMAFVFEKCQRMEMKRIRFVVEMFSGMQKILVDLLNPPKLVQLHTKLRQHFLDINDATIGEDMKRWSLKHGVDSNTKWPQFEEYSSEFRHIHSGSSKAKQRQRQQLEAANAVVLTKKVSRNEDNGPATVASVNGTEQRQHQQQQQNGRGSRFSRSSSQQPSREWTGTASSQNSVGSGSAVVDGEEEPGMELAVDNRNSSNGDHLAKQNSIGSQQSRATSKSSRSQSEKPPPPTSDGNQIQQQLPLQERVQGQRMDRQQLATTAAAIGGGGRHQPRVAGIKMMSPQQQQQQQRPVSSNSASLNDPLAVNSFPMVTPQKSEKVDGIVGVGGESKARAGTVPQSAADIFRKNGKSNAHSQQPNPRSAEESAHEQQEQTEQIDLDQLPPPMPVGPARALYDYEPREDDEIHLTKGEVLDVLHGPDHLGWCMGVRKNKERGLFPALYVSPLIQSADQ